MKDDILYCIQCNKPFTLPHDERDKILERGFSLPRRCPDCRRHKAKMREPDDRWKRKDQKRGDRRKRDYEFEKD
ncbi:MAG: zinc-ribbon domain containing protein [Deltaproteobacteria bacterium]|nr:zinc-ribbon domain containing protein [Deltaproteobacteria bacterium]